MAVPAERSCSRLSAESAAASAFLNGRLRSGFRSCTRCSPRIHFVSPWGGQRCQQVELSPSLSSAIDPSTRGALEEELPEKKKNGSDHSGGSAWCQVKLEHSVLTVPPPTPRLRSLS